MGQVSLRPVVLRWPDEQERRTELRARRLPCLLVVADGASAPDDLGPLEDWVTSSASAEEVEARTAALARWAEGAQDAAPIVDDDDLLRYRGRWVALGAIEARMARLLVARIGTVVRRADLERAAWESTPRRSNTTDATVHRFRLHAASIGLHLMTVRGRGYLLHAPGAPPWPS